MIRKNGEDNGTNNNKNNDENNGNNNDLITMIMPITTLMIKTIIR